MSLKKVAVCDVCNRRMAGGKCFLCGKDLCQDDTKYLAICGDECRIFFVINNTFYSDEQRRRSGKLPYPEQKPICRTHKFNFNQADLKEVFTIFKKLFLVAELNDGNPEEANKP